MHEIKVLKSKKLSGGKKKHTVRCPECHAEHSRELPDDSHLPEHLRTVGFVVNCDCINEQGEFDAKKHRKPQDRSPENKNKKEFRKDVVIMQATFL